MTNADLDNLVDGSGDRSLQDGGLWRSAMQRFRDLSEKLSQRVSGFVAEASAGDQNETALVIRRPSIHPLLEKMFHVHQILKFTPRLPPTRYDEQFFFIFYNIGALKGSITMQMKYQTNSCSA